MSAGFAEGLVGVVLDGRYRLDAVLGEGGMGSVFRAQHLAMDRRVAVKLLKPHLTADRTALERFAREARATLKVDSPHAVKVLDFGVTPQNDYYMALEYLDGRTVQRELDVDGPFAPLRALHVARQALHALAAAHRSGLVHRDLKPDNILLMRVGDDPDYTKLLDFGVAKLMEGAAVTERSELKLTQAGMVFGTPEFMSPEQACGQPLDPRSDLYSLGATLFAMLTGCGLFEGRTPIEWLTHHVRTPPPHLEALAPELAAYPELDEVVQHCLAKQRDHRPGTADELAARLEQIERSIRHGGQAATPRAHQATVRREMSASAYFQPLPPELVEAARAIGPPAAATLTPGRAPVTGLGSDTDAAPIVPVRRGLYLAIGALMILGVIAAAIGVAVTRQDRHAAAPPPVVDAGGRAHDASVVAAPIDAAVVLDAGAPVDAQVAVVADAGTRRRDGGATPAQTSRSAEARAHLAKAEAALRANNRLRQLAEADLALKADPRNLRARYLLGDALIKGGDLDRGCAQLRSLGRNPVAAARARAAHCP